MAPPKSLSEVQMRVYLALINPQYPRMPHTQTQVCDMLGMAKSTVATAVKALIDKDLIRPTDNRRRDIIYEPYRYQEWIKQYINAHVLTNDGGVGSARPHVPTARAHLSGGALWFHVLNEGLHRLAGGPGEDSILLFNKRYTLKGSENITGSVTFDGLPFGLRYMDTANRVKRLAITPPSVYLTAEDVKDGDLTPFLRVVRPLLAEMENVDWEFEKKDGEYVINGKVDIEYGLDEVITDVISPIIPRGMPGQSLIWSDDSPGSQGDNGEVETRKPSLAVALMTSDLTAGQVAQSAEDINALRANIQRIKAELGHQRAILNEIVDALAEVTHSGAVSTRALALITEYLGVQQ